MICVCGEGGGYGGCCLGKFDLYELLHIGFESIN